jgi:hypothetical protein
LNDRLFVGPPHRSRLGRLYHRYFRETRRERLFLASLSFFVTFGITRLITHAMRRGDLFREVWIHGQHVHHLVWGILLLLAVGYMWLIQIGSGHVQSSRVASRVMATLYGAGAALTLDEFALWLNLKDVYWESQGRTSIDAVMLFGALVSAGLWGGPFLRAVARESMRFVRYSWHVTQRRWRKGRLH